MIINTDLFQNIIYIIIYNISDSDGNKEKKVDYYYSIK